VDLRELERRLTVAFAGPLPGEAAQMLLSPRPRRGWRPGELPEGLRRGAVLLLLYPGSEGPSVVLTLRHADLPQHAGQVSLPGGAAEPGETLERAALREAHEEVGVDPSKVRLLGRLSPLHIPVSGFALHPFVGLVEQRPELHPDPNEVERILEVPVATLLDPSYRGEETRRFREHDYQVPFLRLDGEKVWGATAMILAEFLWLLGFRGTQAKGNDGTGS